MTRRGSTFDAAALPNPLEPVSLHTDLLKQAQHLAVKEPRRPLIVGFNLRQAVELEVPDTGIVGMLQM